MKKSDVPVFVTEEDENTDEPYLKLMLPREGLAMEGSGTLRELVGVFNEALYLANLKNQSYGDAWRKQGSMGNLARIMSKVSRLRSMRWRQAPYFPGDGESVRDTALDLVNLAAFFLLNDEENNHWGWDV